MLPHLISIGHKPEANANRGQSYKRSLASGKFSRAVGPDNPCWKGGHAAYVDRRIKSGKAKEALRRYRKLNPDKVREFARRRSGRKIGRLPRGTVKELLKLQHGKCALCGERLHSQFHLDHITPLAKGGKHERYNVQLLCAHCNLTKSDRMPIAFAQSVGMLL